MQPVGKSVPKPSPTANPTISYWRTDLRAIDEHRTTESLPSRADIVIIGAGYSGAAIAHHLLEQSERLNRPSPSILILEARAACSGATGRNGGHLKPDPYSRAANLIKTHGKAVAAHAATFEAQQVVEIKKLVEREGIDCDYEETLVRDVCLYKTGSVKASDDLARIIKAEIPTAHDIQHSSGAEAEEVSGVKRAKSCLTYRAARLWPYKLVTHLLQKATSKGVNLQTWTPVVSVTPANHSTEGARWYVNTTRGAVEARTVLHATNGYISALVPELKDKIVPVKGMAARLVGTNLPKMLDSYMLRISEYEYDYMIPRPDGSIIVGGARQDFYRQLEEWFNVSDDSSLMRGGHSYFDHYMQRHFHGWESSDARPENMWTGIMGYSNDGFPYVGPIHHKPGQYVCAGFSGHGMPQIFLSAKAIASMVLTGSEAEGVDLPLPYHVSRERWDLSEEHVSLRAWRSVTRRQPESARL